VKAILSQPSKKVVAAAAAPSPTDGVVASQRISPVKCGKTESVTLEKEFRPTTPDTPPPHLVPPNSPIHSNI